jgi:hypothetical protein
MVEKLSKIVAVILIALVTSPVTAPFASYDLSTDPSAVQDPLGSDSKTTDDAAILPPGPSIVDTAAFAIRHDPLVSVPQVLRASCSTVLRL